MLFWIRMEIHFGGEFMVVTTALVAMALNFAQCELSDREKNHQPPSATEIDSGAEDDNVVQKRFTSEAQACSCVATGGEDPGATLIYASANTSHNSFTRTFVRLGATLPLPQCMLDALDGLFTSLCGTTMFTQLAIEPQLLSRV